VRERTSSCNAQIYALVCVRKRDRESVCGEERIFGAKSGEKKAVQVLSDTLTTKNGHFGPLDALLGILRTKTMSIKPHTSIMSYYLYKYTFTHKRRAIYTHSSLCVCVYQRRPPITGNAVKKSMDALRLRFWEYFLISFI